MTPRRSPRVAAQAATKVESLDTAKVTKPKKVVKKTTTSSSSTSTSSSSSTEIEIGDDIPDITLTNQDETELNLKDLSSKNDIILIFAYPKASTPGCTRQACGFRDNFNSISDKALILGLSADSAKAQTNFKNKQHLQYDLLCDTKKELIGVLGAKKSPSGIKRSYWIFHKGKLVVKRVQVSPEVSVKEGKEKVLELSSA
ncbi:Peroxiredoxin DOT5 [Cyberlindnera fabianii]|uniref:thioredoxin-dependent peroxiredoxin n=1 Tax=Cyberlindnera fabianii TaxID=36022 RepID=A0A1V2L234_CYBFA|nr:Peroxiredoxin DOT5 [Cyberlindnera fabianii]